MPLLLAQGRLAFAYPMSLALSARGGNALAREPRRLVRGEEQRHARDVVRLAEAPQRDRQADRFCRFKRDSQGSEAFGLRHTWRDGVDTDLPVPQFFRQRLGDRIDRGLRGRIDDRTRHRVNARNRAVIDHAAALAIEAAHRLLSRKQRSQNVGVELAMELLFRYRLERLESEHAGVVDQNAGRAELRLGFRKQALNLGAP